MSAVSSIPPSAFSGEQNTSLPTPPTSSEKITTLVEKQNSSPTPSSSVYPYIKSQLSIKFNSSSSTSSNGDSVGIRSKTAALSGGSTPKESDGVLTILGSIANLLMKQSEILKNHDDRFDVATMVLNERMDTLEEKITNIVHNFQMDDMELQYYLKNKVDEAVGRLDRLKGSENAIRRLGRGRPPKNLINSKLRNSIVYPWEGETVLENTPVNRRENLTPTSSEVFVDDLIRFDSPPIDPVLTFQPAITDQTICQLSISPFDSEDNPASPLLANDDHLQASTHLPSGTLVDQAIEKERLLLNGQSVVKEGENTVDFIFRKRMMKGKAKDNFQIDMSFLDQISIDSQAMSNDNYEPSILFSGVDSLPYTPNHSSPCPEAGPSNPRHSTRSTAKIPWTPFPLTYMREPTRSASVPNSIASSDISHLSSVKRGVSLVDDNLLLPSEIPSIQVSNPRKRKKSKYKGWSNNKKRKTTSQKNNGWPDFGLNTIKSRMEEIICDTCRGRVHWACAGLAHGKNMRETPWSCPNCIATLLEADEYENGELPSIPRAQRDRCQRPNCIYRSAKKIVKKSDEMDQFLMERIIGRKRLHFNQNGGGGATYEYLVKWYDWEIYDSTWEPATHIPNLELNEATFLQSIKHEGPDIHLQKVLLAEECNPWFDHKGNYNIELLQSLNIEKRQWWYD